MPATHPASVAQVSAHAHNGARIRETRFRLRRIGATAGSIDDEL